MQDTLVSMNVHEIREDKVETLENEGNQGQIGQENTSTPPTQDQSTTGTTQEEKDKTEELRLTSKPNEQLQIKALLTLLESITPPSQDIQRLSIDDTSTLR